jgi:hypothetical protein
MVRCGFSEPIHARQEGRFFHGCYCYLPLYILCGEELLCARLRKSDIDACAGSIDELERIIGQIRALLWKHPLLLTP